MSKHGDASQATGNNSLKPSELTASQVQELESVARQVATLAGDFIHSQRPADSAMGVTTKSSTTDVVTVMDQAAQDLIVRELAAARPQDAVWGEEQGERAGSSGLTWVIDPIDGTVNYLYGIPAYAVSVAVVTGHPASAGSWSPIAACVTNPSTQEVFSAGTGQGAYKQIGAGPKRRLQVAAAADLSTALTGTGFGYDAAKRRWQGQILLELIDQVRDIRRMGSAALDLCHIADGQLDAYYECGLNAWDFAGGWLIAQEAGAQVSGGAQQPPSSDLLIAGAPHLCQALEQRLSSLLEQFPWPTPAGRQ